MSETTYERVSLARSTLLASILDDDWKTLVHASTQLFSSLQFERNLTAASELLERALSSREQYLQLAEKEIVARQERITKDLSLKQERTRVGNKPDGEYAPQNDTAYGAGGQPIAYAALDWARLRASHLIAGDTNDPSSLKSSYWQQEQNIGYIINAPRTETSLTDLRRANADYHALTAVKTKWNAEISTIERELSAHHQELNRKRESLSLAELHAEEIETASTNSGVLDITDQLVTLAARIDRDLCEALLRLSAAETGLADILGHSELTPLDPTRHSRLKLVSVLVERVRSLVLWHSIRTQHDQAFSFVVSLRSRVVDSAWRSFLTGGELSFSLETPELSDWSYIRLRGVSASYTGKNSSPLALTVRVPPVGAAQRGQKRLDQSTVSKCRLGRVSRTDSTRAPEVNGSVTLMNATPVGCDASAWTVKIEPSFGEDADSTVEVGDVFLELLLVGIPVDRSDLHAISWKEAS